MTADGADFSQTLDQPQLKRFQRKLTVLSAASMTLDGYDIAVIAIALPVVTKLWDISPALQGVVAASTVIGMLFGGLIGGRLTDIFGRRIMFLLTLLSFVFFAALTAVAQDVWQLIIFRLLLGFGLGADYAVAPSLMGEFSSTSGRAKQVGGIPASFFVVGFVAYVMGVVTLPLGDNGWRLALLLGALFGIVVVILRRTIPESPRWLSEQGRDADAQAVIAGLTGEQVSSRSMSGHAQPRSTRGTRSRWVDLFSPSLIRVTVLVCGFWFFYDIAYYGITAYTPTILRPFTEGSAAGSNMGSAIISLVGLVGALIGLILVDILGRRPLIIIAFAGLTMALIILAINPQPAFAGLVILFSVALLFSNMGPGILDILYPTELYPTGVRAAGTGLATAVSRAGAILGILVFPQLMSAWGLSNALWLFVGAGAVGLVICVILAPETRGRSLEETTRMFQKEPD